MDFDEVERLARGIIIDRKTGSLTFEATQQLARAVLLLLPVVRAAERMRNAGIECESTAPEDFDRGRKWARYSDGCFAVERAIDTLRRSLTPGTGGE